MSKKINTFITFVLFLIVVGGLLFRQKRIQEVISNSKTQEQVEQTPTIAPSAQMEFKVGNEEPKKAYEFVATMSGQNALDLVQSQVKLDLKKYDFGMMIEGVADLKTDSTHYWALYQGGDYAKVGISDLKLEKNEKIELKYEEIKL